MSQGAPKSSAVNMRERVRQSLYRWSWSRLAAVLVMLLATSSSVRSQVVPFDCSEVGWSATTDPECVEEILGGLLELECMGAEGGYVDLLGCTGTIYDLLEKEKIRYVDPDQFPGWFGEPGSLAITAPDCMDNSTMPPKSVWKSSSGCNCILINLDYVFWDCQIYTDDPGTSRLLLAAALVHECCHALTLDNALQGGAWVDRCDYLANEIFCNCEELAVLCAAESSGCVAIGDWAAFEQRKADVHQYKEAWEVAKFHECGC